MNSSPPNRRRLPWTAACAALLIGISPLPAPAAEAALDTVSIVALQGTAEVSTDGGTSWILTQTNQVLRPAWHLRTGPNSRVALLWSAKSVASFGALTEIEIAPPPAREDQSAIRLFKGIMSFFHRDKPGRIRVITRGGIAGVEGTEFVMSVEGAAGTETTRISVIDGLVRFSNEQDALVVTNGQQAMAGMGQAPRFTAGFIVNNVLQWCFYYPAVLDLRDLPLAPDEEQSLRESLVAYRAGDLLNALVNYPADRRRKIEQLSLGTSDAERVYYAALLLSVGQVEKTESILSNVTSPLASALRQLIAAVKRQSTSPLPSLNLPLPSQLLAASYFAQSRATGDDALREALRLAREAANQSPEFGFSWARVAELEFSFGHTDRAIEALDKSLALSPRNAQALALKGFLLAARNKIREAIEWFDRAIAVDSALGNAWLGRGLCRIRRGDRLGGGEDLLMAAALEPQRALLRSYLGKTYGNFGDPAQARHELALAKHLDPADPTAWLYSALLNEQDNRFNEGIRDLEKSQGLNDNRRLYRSRLLLDQDQAVRSSSLAQLYREASMPEVSAREAARAVNYDYANYSAHQFLAESFNALRDPTRFNLRHETVWFNELLLANLLSPVGGTPLSQNISQYEYARLFEQNRVGLSSATEYRSDGQVRELASQFGVLGNTGWSLDLDYQHNDGVRPNNELDRIEWYSTIKQQFTPQDSVLVLTKYQDYHSGDNFQYYDPSAITTNLNAYSVTNAPIIRTNYTFDEYQSPIIVAGYHHEWSPRVHTLWLGGRLENDQRFRDTEAFQYILTTNASGVIGVGNLPMDVALRSQFEIFTSELNQIFQTERQHLVLGGRFQTGQFESTDRITLSGIDNAGLTNFFNKPPASRHIKEGFERVSAYGYHTLELFDHFRLTGGLTYDRVKFPINFRQPPIAPGSDERDRLSPKGALVWSPIPELTVRGIYSRALGGVTFDESFRLEPTQLAGFNQAFRTIISESVVGSVSAPTFDVAGAALDLKLKSGTYLGIQVERLNSEVRRQLGVFSSTGTNPPPPPFLPYETPQRLDYEERSVSATANQLICDALSFGAQYRYTDSELHTTWPAIPVSVAGFADTRERAELHQSTVFALFNHPSGFFARADGTWYHQRNSGYTPPLTSSDFLQGNVFVGWRLRRQRGELSVGVLNLSGTDYRLNPLTPYSELPRERVFAARLKFNF